jgi:hypothetical protein
MFRFLHSLLTSSSRHVINHLLTTAVKSCLQMNERNLDDNYVLLVGKEIVAMQASHMLANWANP